MAWLQVQTAGLLLTLALQFYVIVAPDAGLSGVVPERRDSVDIVKKESHPVLVRQKRAWVWNSISVTEEREAPTPYKIKQVWFLRSDQKVAVRTFTIEGEGVNQTFIVDNKGNLYVKERLDREKKAWYHLTARMYDGNGLLIEDAGEFDIEVTDINDNCPVFQEEYKGSIMERTIQVKATDADDPNTDNGQVRYTLLNGRTSGVITTKVSSLDRETKSQYVVVVRAQDMKGRESGCIATTSVAITITDANDNIASFTKRKYEISVPENLKVNEKIGILELIDLDEDENKQPIFSIPSGNGNVFSTKPSKDNNCILVLKQGSRGESEDHVQIKAFLFCNILQVTIKVTDVDEPPVFTHSIYNFSVLEEQMEKTILGRLQARDPDGVRKRIEYGSPYSRVQLCSHSSCSSLIFMKCLSSVGLASFAEVFVTVLDVNDNPPELIANDIFVCENDVRNTVRGEHSKYHNTAALLVKEGPFNLEDSSDYSVEVRISDGGQPLMSSITKLQIKVLLCFALIERGMSNMSSEGASMQRMGVSVHALITILLCILTILVIVILFVMRKHYQKDSLASMKNNGEIHEQLVTYDEEGGGEMDTNGYNVSILTSACNDSSLLRHPDRRSHPSMYAMVQKPHHLSQPTACKGDMAAMIDMKKDEADHDRDGVPYDTLHIYGYEGPESLAASLSSLDSSSSGSNVDYDFLNNWGPRFKALAELYGVDEEVLLVSVLFGI
uniref:Cadherin-5 n=1 Tax=Poecilia reticulata TaxID=8081 RepID=A0A3P9NKH3_POERE